MFAYVPRHVLLSHNPVLKATKSVTRHLCLDNNSVPSLRYHEPFIPPQAHSGGSWCTHVSPSDMAIYSCCATNVVQRRFSCPLSFCRTATAVVRQTSHGDNSVICCCSSIQLRPSCRERNAEMILRSAILSFWRTAAIVATIFLRNRVVVSIVSFWCHLATLIVSAHLSYVSVNSSRFTGYFLTLGSVDTSTSSLKVIPYTWLTHTSFI